MPSDHSTPSGTTRVNIGLRASTPLAIPARTPGVSPSPVTPTTLRGGSPARTRSSTRATAARPCSGPNGVLCHSGSRRVTHVVAAAYGAISRSSCTAVIPPPTTTTRFPAMACGPG